MPPNPCPPLPKASRIWDSGCDGADEAGAVSAPGEADANVGAADDALCGAEDALAVAMGAAVGGNGTGDTDCSAAHPTNSASEPDASAVTVRKRALRNALSFIEAFTA